MAELNTLSPKKWIDDFSGVAPTLDFTTDDIRTGDYAIDTSVSPPLIWVCLNQATPVWILEQSVYSRSQTLTDGANITVNLNLGGVMVVTLGGNRTLDNPTGQTAGTKYVLRVIQDGTGGRTLAYGNLYKFPGGVLPTLSSTAGAIDILEFKSDGTNMNLVNAVFAMG
jgi:hypothetical protein